MGKPFATKTLSAIAVAVVLLGLLSPVAAGMLLCIGDGTDPDCCSKPRDPDELRLDESKQLLDGDCGCCITVEAAPATRGAGSHKASLDIAFGSRLLRNAVTPAGTRNLRGSSREASGTCLSSLRTVVLLI